MDYLVELEHVVLIFEVKLTQQAPKKILRQVVDLYKPVVELAYGKPALCVQICKNLVDAGPALVRNLRMLPTFQPSNRVWTVHWVGEQHV